MKIIFSTMLLMVFSSCVTTSASHQHLYVGEGNTDIQLKVFCSANDKLFLIENSNKSYDSIYIKSKLFEDPHKYYLMDDSNGFNNSSKKYKIKIKIKDKIFHKAILSNTINIKTVRFHKTQIFKFNVLKDSRLK